MISDTDNWLQERVYNITILYERAVDCYTQERTLYVHIFSVKTHLRITAIIRFIVDIFRKKNLNK